MRYTLLYALFFLSIVSGCEKAQEEMEDSVIRLKYVDLQGDDLLANKNGTKSDNIRIFYKIDNKLILANRVNENPYTITIDLFDGFKYILLRLDCSQKQTMTYIEFDGNVNDSIGAIYVTGRDYFKVKTMFYNKLPIWNRSSSQSSDMRLFRITKDSGVLNGVSSIAK